MAVKCSSSEVVPALFGPITKTRDSKLALWRVFRGTLSTSLSRGCRGEDASAPRAPRSSMIALRGGAKDCLNETRLRGTRGPPHKSIVHMCSSAFFPSEVLVFFFSSPAPASPSFIPAHATLFCVPWASCQAEGAQGGTQLRQESAN